MSPPTMPTTIRNAAIPIRITAGNKSMYPLLASIIVVVGNTIAFRRCGYLCLFKMRYEHRSATILRRHMANAIALPPRG
jgi:hypothetical protein